MSPGKQSVFIRRRLEQRRRLKDSSDKILDDRGWTPLHIEARKGNLKQVRRLLDEGANVNVRALGPKFRGATPLHLASAGGHLKVMNELLERGADIDARTKGGACGWTPIHYAAKQQNKKAIEFLIENGAFLPAHMDDTRFNPDLHYCPGLEWAYEFKMVTEITLISFSSDGTSCSEENINRI